MAVDLKLNEMIGTVDDMLAKLERIPVADVELSVRALRGLQSLGARTMADAWRAVIDRTLIKQHHIGRRTVDEVRELVINILGMPDEALPQPASNVLTEEDTELDALRYYCEQLQDQINKLIAERDSLSVEPERIKRMLWDERNRHAETRRKLERVLSASRVGDLRALGITVEIDTDTVED